MVTLCATPALADSCALLVPVVPSPATVLVASVFLELSWLASGCVAGSGAANRGMGTGALVLTDVMGLLTTFVCSKRNTLVKVSCL